MRHRHRIIPLVLLIVSFLYVPFRLTANTNAVARGFETLPMGSAASRPAFVPNRGQISSPHVQYSILLPKAKLHFTAQGVTMLLAQHDAQFSEAQGNPIAGKTPRTVDVLRMDLHFANTKGAASIRAAQKNTERFHFYTAAAPGGITDVPSFNELYYCDVYPFIDARFTITGDGLKYEFIVHPGGDPADIILEYTGADRVLPLPDGRLQVAHAGGTLIDAAPVSFVDGEQVPTRFVLTGNSYGFDIDTYDPHRPLIIDPCIMWSSFYGGTTSDLISGVATDAGGFIIFTGFTSSTDFPVTSALQGASAGSIDAFVVKLDGEGKRLWATYYGGSGSEDWPRITTDPSNSVIIGGYTSSLDFPTSASAYQRENGGKIDAFILKLTSQGKREWATLFGGSFAEECGDIASDGAGGIYITGNTFSTNLPVTENADQTSNQGDFDAFVAKFDSEGALLWATYLGGWSLDYGTGLAISPSGSLAVTGYTESTNFPVSANAMQAEHRGGRYDAFIAQYNTNGRRLWTSYFGGADDDQGMAVAYGPSGTLYFTGHTKSSDLKTQGEGQNAFGGSHDAFVGALLADGTAQWLSYYGGKGSEQATGIAVDAKGIVYICGFKIGDDLPGANGGFGYDTPSSMDAFLLKMDGSGNRLWATSFGGPLGDLAYGIVLDEKGNIIMAGETGSKAFPTAGSPFQKNLAGYEDGFIVKFLFYEPLVEAGADIASCAEEGIVLEPTVTQGVPPYTYAWSPRAGLDDHTSKTPRAIPTTTTTYTLTITDSYGCIGSDTVTVMVNERPTVDPGADLDLCPGSTVALAANVTGGSAPYSYEWSPARGLSAVNEARPTASPRATTTYSVRVTDAKGCSHRDSVTVHVLPAPTANGGPDKVVCKGSPAPIGGDATGGSPPYSYEWSPAIGLDNALIASPLASPEKDAVYYLTVTDSKGCAGYDTVRVRVLPSLTISAGKNQTICYGETVSIGGTPKGGKAPYIYSWAPTEGLTASQAYTTDATPLETTTYTLTVTDASGCVSTSAVTIAVRDRLFARAGEDKNICAGSGTSIGEASQGGSPPYSYKWNPASGLSSATAATPTASPEKTTNYILTVTDATGCTAYDTLTVSVMNAPKPVLMKNQSLCQGEELKLEATVQGGTQPYAYNWNPPFGLSDAKALSPLAKPVQTVSYILTVTDANGCMGSDTVTLTVHPAPVLDPGKNISVCRGATAEIGSKASGGKGPFKYAWSPDAGMASPGEAVTKVRPNNTTTYTLTVTDANGCTATATYTVEVLDCPSGDAGTDAELCLGAVKELGGTTAGGRPPYSYVWLPTAGLNDPAAAQPIARPATTTAYEMTITDANGCKFRDSVTVAVFQPPQIRAGDDRAICYGATAELKAEVTGGKAPYEYFWTPAGQLEVSNQPSFSPVPKQTTLYVVTVKDANGCSSSDSVSVSVAPPLTVRTNEDAVICRGASVELLADVEGGQPPFSYSWNGVDKNDAKKKSVLISPEKTAVYRVTVTDATGCTASDSVGITLDEVPDPVIIVEDSNPGCDGDSVRLHVQQEFATFAWSTGATSRAIILTETETVTVTASNARGCSADSKPVQVVIHPQPVPEIDVRGGTEICEGDKTVLAATKKFKKYEWSSGETTQSITVRTAGEYRVIVTDANGCTGASVSVQIIVHPAPKPSIVKYSDTLVTEQATSYQWLLNNRPVKGATAQRYLPAKSGKYAVRIKNENGCSAVSDMMQIRIAKKKK